MFKKKIVLIIIISICLLSISGVLIYYYSSSKVEKNISGLYLVDDHKMYIECIGSGSPTVILDTGAGDSAEELWGKIPQDTALKAQTRVCSYDRAGLGKSPEPGPLPRNSENIAKELDTLLQTAGVDGPYILVGHSTGTLHIRKFAQLYPNKVIGMVLIDNANQETFSYLVSNIGDDSPNDSNTSESFSHDEDNTNGELNTQEAIPFGTSADATNTSQAVIDEQDAATTDIIEVSSIPLPNIPIIVIAATKITADAPEFMKQNGDRAEANIAYQKKIADSAPQGELILAENSDHMIPVQQPDIIVDAIVKMVSKLRNQL